MEKDKCCYDDEEDRDDKDDDRIIEKIGRHEEDQEEY